MTNEEILKIVENANKHTSAINKTLKEILDLDNNCKINLIPIQKKLTLLEEYKNQTNNLSQFEQAFYAWFELYSQKIKDEQNDLQKSFGLELEELLKKIGLTLTGQYPILKAGIFFIDISFENLVVTLWYGPKQERIDKIPLNPGDIEQKIKEKLQNLGCGLNTDDFISRLKLAYQRTEESKDKQPAPIIKVLFELSHLLQSPGFAVDPKKEFYKSYSRADFSYDLFKIIKEPYSNYSRNLHLTIATRSHTQNRQSYLWIPNDDNGNGTAYSHLSFQEIRL